MAFLDELRQHLEGRGLPEVPFGADLPAHRKHVLSALEELERTQPTKIPSLHEFWSSHIDAFAAEMGALLTAGLAHGSSPDQVTALINVAISRDIGLDTSAGSIVRDLEIDRLGKQARETATGRRADNSRERRQSGDMSPTGKILIVDDDPSFVKLYENRLGEEGYLVETASDVPAALAKLDEGGWDAVLLDQKLQGKDGPDTGLDLLAEVARRAPGVKTILVTAYATPAAITRAFQGGVYDYLQKDEFFRVLLLPKLRNAVEAVRARRLGELDAKQTEASVRDTWSALEVEPDPNRKGKLLEDLLVLLVRTIPGFHHTEARRRNDIEEIDVLIRNESTDPFWINERTSYILVECKNWTKPVGVGELRSFVWKLERRYGRCRLGFFVAMGGFTASFKEDLRAERKDDTLVVLLDREDLRELVQSTDRSATLKKLHTQAVAQSNGH